MIIKDEQFQELQTQVSNISTSLKTVTDNHDTLNDSVKDWSNFQLKEPLDPFTQRLISTILKNNIVRVYSSSTSASLTIDSDSFNLYIITALASAITINTPTGNPVDGQSLVIRIIDNGTARAITWSSAFRVIGTTLPTTTTISKYNYISCRYNIVNSKWDVLMVNQEV